MGMYDRILCRWPLPEGQDVVYQTKDTPARFLDTYEIRADGTFWHQTYDVEDRSDPNAEGAARIGGMWTCVPTGWEPELFNGTIYFYQMDGNTWLDWYATFKRGKLTKRGVHQRPERVVE